MDSQPVQKVAPISESAVSNSPQTSPSSGQSFLQKFKWLLLGFTAVLVIAGFGGVYLLDKKDAQKSQVQPQTQQTIAQPTSTPTPDETASWKTFSFAKFYFKYPSDKFVVEERVKDYFVIKPIDAISGFAGIEVEARYPDADYKGSVEDLKKQLLNPKEEAVPNGVKISGKFGPSQEEGMSMEGMEIIGAYLIYNNNLVIMSSTDASSFSYFDRILSTFKFTQ